MLLPVSAKELLITLLSDLELTENDLSRQLQYCLNYRVERHTDTHTQTHLSCPFSVVVTRWT